MVIDRYLHWVGRIIVGDIVPFNPSHALNYFHKTLNVLVKHKMRDAKYKSYHRPRWKYCHGHHEGRMCLKIKD